MSYAAKWGNVAPTTDFHAHAFPDALARRAIGSLEESGGIRAYTDGTVRGLLAAMDRAGIGRSVLCSIATKPSQFADIMAWSEDIRSERLIPLPSVHPRDPQLLTHVRQIRDQGFAGIKMHPYYQQFNLEDPDLFSLYEELATLDLMLVIHAGYDIAFPRERRADPARVLSVTMRFPELKLIVTHMGGWEDWDAVEEHLIGRPIYLESSFGADYLTPERMRRMVLAHPQGYILFGSDSPWTDQQKSLENVRLLQLPCDVLQGILCDNARRLLGGHCQPE